MAQLKACPPERLEEASRKADQYGQQHLVIFDSVMFEYKVVSIQTYNGCGYGSNSRYETVAVAE